MSAASERLPATHSPRPSTGERTVMDQPADERDAVRALDRARDTRLVLAIRAGDANAFGQLYDLWFDRVYDLASRIVRDPAVAAEVAQDTFLKAWRSPDGLENPDSFGGWLLRIARNAAYNRSEREGRSSAVDDQGLAVIESVGASPVSAPAGFGVEDRLGRAATPDSCAAFATAGAMRRIRRASNGFGMMYSGPNASSCPAYATATSSLISAFASAAISRTAASFIASVIAVAPASSAPRKMYGKHRTLLTWFG